MEYVAEKAGISYNTLRDFEIGKTSPGIDVFVAICGVLGMSPSDAWGDGGSFPINLSPRAISDGPTALDVALIAVRLSSVSPGQRAMALSILFGDPKLMAGFEVAGALARHIEDLLRVE